ncbi:hypothetical protein E2C01_080473 [Portunus trituberculatus]|uniref:Uncharacterized protein n=1 Tax=Portunus trituberculatus TaxID=210409 RepID=A0A5B7IU67_PORTR|nr:hypothetical protein [Portunus trituberculatus]
MVHADGRDEHHTSDCGVDINQLNNFKQLSKSPNHPAATALLNSPTMTHAQSFPHALEVRKRKARVSGVMERVADFVDERVSVMVGNMQ